MQEYRVSQELFDQLKELYAKYTNESHVPRAFRLSLAGPSQEIYLVEPEPEKSLGEIAYEAYAAVLKRHAVTPLEAWNELTDIERQAWRQTAVAVAAASEKNRIMAEQCK